MCERSASIYDYFSEGARRIVEHEIQSAQGNEVLFFGWLDARGRVDRVEVRARGNLDAVVVPVEQSFVPDVIIHNHPDGNLSPSEQDLAIASVVAQRAVGFFIVDNSVSDIYAAVEPVGKREQIPLDVERLAALVSKQGPLSGSFDNFEERQGQKQMIRLTCESFNHDLVALIEAGTGIGKSLAYLIPSVEWSIENKEQVIISTNTINLQEQLLLKDIPDLKSALDLDISYVLMKGRGNYVCLNRLYEASQDLFSLIDEEELHQFQEILKWIERTDDGSLSDLSFVPRSSLWEKINSQTEMCMGQNCGYFNRCFFNRVKRKSSSAHIIVTNHHYLLANAYLTASGASILPNISRVIFDEAHNLEDAATSFFTRRITLEGFIGVLNRLYSGEKKKKGYLVHLLRKKIWGDKEKAPAVFDQIDSLKSRAFDLFDGIDQLFSLARSEGSSLDSSTQWDSISVGTVQKEPVVIEMGKQLEDHPHWEGVILSRIGSFHKECTLLVNRLHEMGNELKEKKQETIARQIDGFLSRILETVETLDIFLRDDDNRHVKWLEKRKRSAIMVSPIDVGAILQDLVFQKIKSSVLTSATLTVNGRFHFIKERLSLNDSAIEAQIDSPFDYSEQMGIIIPSDTVEPGAFNYHEKLAKAIFTIVKKTHGRAFVLFTSYRTLNEVYESIEEELSESGLILLRQGSDSRRYLLDTFKTNISATLFGTESFWEGVDAPGQTLECVIITKLPFKVPTEPVTRARMERISQNGGNPFLDYSLPLAVIKMKQGIGRLIRKKTDRGLIAILDRRVLVKNYGGVFLNSIPGGRVYKGRLEDVLKRVENFLPNNDLTKCN